jgi:hypothetical protein
MHAQNLPGRTLVLLLVVAALCESAALGAQPLAELKKKDSYGYAVFQGPPDANGMDQLMTKASVPGQSIEAQYAWVVYGDDAAVILATKERGGDDHQCHGLGQKCTNDVAVFRAGEIVHQDWKDGL